MVSSLWRAGFSVVMAHGLRCPVACGIWVPRMGVELESPALQGRFSTAGPPRKSLQSSIVNYSHYGVIRSPPNFFIVWFLLRTVQPWGSVPDLSPGLTDSHLLSVSSYGLPSVCVCVQISSYYKDTSHIGLYVCVSCSVMSNSLL